jgi:hypothetical protein
MKLPSLFVKLLMLPLLIIVILVLFSLIEPMKVMTDIPRISMNCPNTNSFDSTAWNSMSSSNHTIYSTSCYALNWDMLIFIVAIGGLAVWAWWNK